MHQSREKRAEIQGIEVTSKESKICLLSSWIEPGPAVLQIVDKNELAEIVQGREVRSSLVRFCELFHKVDKIRVLCHHKGAHRDLFPPALHSLVERLVHDALVQSERILIDPTYSIEDRGWFAVGDHEDLLVDVSRTTEGLASKLQSGPRGGVEGTDIQEWQFGETDDLRLIAEDDAGEVVLRKFHADELSKGKRHLFRGCDAVFAVQDHAVTDVEHENGRAA